MSLGLLPGGSTGSIGSFLGFDGDGLGGADGLAELAGDAALLAAGVAPKGVLAPKPRRQGALFERVVDGGGLLEDGAQSDHETANEFSQKPTEKSFNKIRRDKTTSDCFTRCVRPFLSALPTLVHLCKG